MNVLQACYELVSLSGLESFEEPNGSNFLTSKLKYVEKECEMVGRKQQGRCGLARSKVLLFCFRSLLVVIDNDGIAMSIRQRCGDTAIAMGENIMKNFDNYQEIAMNMMVCLLSHEKRQEADENGMGSLGHGLYDRIASKLCGLLIEMFKCNSFSVAFVNKLLSRYVDTNESVNHCAQKCKCGALDFQDTLRKCLKHCMKVVTAFADWEKDDDHFYTRIASSFEKMRLVLIEMNENLIGGTSGVEALPMCDECSNQEDKKLSLCTLKPLISFYEYCQACILVEIGQTNVNSNNGLSQLVCAESLIESMNSEEYDYEHGWIQRQTLLVKIKLKLDKMEEAAKISESILLKDSQNMYARDTLGAFAALAASGVNDVAIECEADFFENVKEYSFSYDNDGNCYLFGGYREKYDDYKDYKDYNDYDDGNDDNDDMKDENECQWCLYKDLKFEKYRNDNVTNVSRSLDQLVFYHSKSNKMYCIEATNKELIGGRHGHSSVIINDKLIIIGGSRIYVDSLLKHFILKNKNSSYLVDEHLINMKRELNQVYDNEDDMFMSVYDINKKEWNVPQIKFGRFKDYGAPVRHRHLAQHASVAVPDTQSLFIFTLNPLKSYIVDTRNLNNEKNSVKCGQIIDKLEWVPTEMVQGYLHCHKAFYNKNNKEIIIVYIHESMNVYMAVGDATYTLRDVNKTKFFKYDLIIGNSSQWLLNDMKLWQSTLVDAINGDFDAHDSCVSLSFKTQYALHKEDVLPKFEVAMINDCLFITINYYGREMARINLDGMEPVFVPKTKTLLFKLDNHQNGSKIGAFFNVNSRDINGSIKWQYLPKDMLFVNNENVVSLIRVNNDGAVTMESFGDVNGIISSASKCDRLQDNAIRVPVAAYKNVCSFGEFEDSINENLCNEMNYNFNLVVLTKQSELVRSILGGKKDKNGKDGKEEIEDNKEEMDQDMEYGSSEYDIMIETIDENVNANNDNGTGFLASHMFNQEMSDTIECDYCHEIAINPTYYGKDSISLCGTYCSENCIKAASAKNGNRSLHKSIDELRYKIHSRATVGILNKSENMQNIYNCSYESREDYGYEVIDCTSKVDTWLLMHSCVGMNDCRCITGSRRNKDDDFSIYYNFDMDDPSTSCDARFAIQLQSIVVSTNNPPNEHDNIYIQLQGLPFCLSRESNELNEFYGEWDDIATYSYTDILCNKKFGIAGKFSNTYYKALKLTAYKNGEKMAAYDKDGEMTDIGNFEIKRMYGNVIQFEKQPQNNEENKHFQSTIYPPIGNTQCKTYAIANDDIHELKLRKYKISLKNLINDEECDILSDELIEKEWKKIDLIRIFIVNEKDSCRIILAINGFSKYKIDEITMTDFDNVEIEIKRKTEKEDEKNEDIIVEKIQDVEMQLPILFQNELIISPQDNSNDKKNAIMASGKIGTNDKMNDKMELEDEMNDDIKDEGNEDTGIATKASKDTIQKEERNEECDIDSENENENKNSHTGRRHESRSKAKGDNDSDDSLDCID